MYNQHSTDVTNKHEGIESIHEVRKQEKVSAINFWNKIQVFPSYIEHWSAANC